MKEKLTLRNLVIAIVFVLGIVALIVSFKAGSKIPGTIEVEMKGLIFGKQEMFVNGKGQGAVDAVVHAKLSQLGVIMLVVAPVLALVSALVLPKAVAKKVILALAVVAVVGVVFVAMMKGSYARQTVKYQVGEAEKAGMEVTAEMKKELLEEVKESMKENKPNGATIVVVILGALEAVGLAVSQFLPEKK